MAIPFFTKTTVMMKFVAFCLAIICISTFLPKQEDICDLPAPTNNGSTHNGSSLSCAWTSVSGAVSYKIRVFDLDNGNELVYSNDAVSGTSQNVSGTNAGHDYRIQIAANCTGPEPSTNIIVVDLLGVKP